VYLGSPSFSYIDGAKYIISGNQNNVLKYGPYSDTDPKMENRSIIHYENHFPFFLTVEKLVRNIKISHWGYITVWDIVSLHHTGPELKGPYERGIYKNNPPDTRVESFITTLPSGAFDIYIKDEIGQLYNFVVDESHDKVDVKIKPRFILYGGWKTEYEIGYTLPSSEYMINYYDKYTLTIPIVDKIFHDMIIKEANVNIILPEGAEFDSINPSFQLLNNSQFCYFVDVICRKVVSFVRHNIVENHMGHISVVYYHSQLYLLLKPVSVAAFIAGLFITFILFNRLTFMKGVADITNNLSQRYQGEKRKDTFVKHDKKKKVKKTH